MLPHIGDRLIEIRECPVGESRDAVLLQFFLTEFAVILETVRVRSAADDQLPFVTKTFCIRAVTQDIVKHDDIRPLHVGFPIAALFQKPLADIALFLVIDEHLDLMSFLFSRPREVKTETGHGYEQKFLRGYRGPTPRLLSSRKSFFRKGRHVVAVSV